MKPFLLIVAFLVTTSLTWAQTTGSSSVATAKGKGKALALFAPRPKYPTDSQGRHPTGYGIVLMHVNTQTGWVISAKMQKSTGNKLLDDAAMEAFSHWRFRPGTVEYVHSPITFTNRGRPRTN